MTFFADLSLAQQDTINRSRALRGLPPLCAYERVENPFERTVTASTDTLRAVAQEFAPQQVGGESRYELTIKTLSSPEPVKPPTLQPPPSPSQPRWTQPSSEPQSPSSSSFVPEPQGLSTFGQTVSAIAVTRLGKRARAKFTKPEPEDPKPGSFAEKVARAIKRRRPQWRQPSN